MVWSENGRGDLVSVSLEDKFTPHEIEICSRVLCAIKAFTWEHFASLVLSPNKGTNFHDEPENSPIAALLFLVYNVSTMQSCGSTKNLIVGIVILLMSSGCAKDLDENNSAVPVSEKKINSLHTQKEMPVACDPEIMRAFLQEQERQQEEVDRQNRERHREWLLQQEEMIRRFDEADRREVERRRQW